MTATAELCLHAGAQLDRAPGPKYTEALGFAELAPKPPLPRAATLREWRTRAPESFTFSLVAPRVSVAGSKGAMRFDEELEAGVRWLRDAAEALGVRAIVVPTDADTTTGQRDRDLLARYFERLSGFGHALVWAPSGLWEPELSRPFAAQLGIACALDPIDEDVPDAAIVYGRLRAIGGRQRFSEGMLEEVVGKLLAAGVPEAFVAIDSQRSFREATKLAAIAAAETVGG